MIAVAAGPDRTSKSGAVSLPASASAVHAAKDATTMSTRATSSPRFTQKGWSGPSFRPSFFNRER